MVGTRGKSLCAVAALALAALLIVAEAGAATGVRSRITLSNRCGAYYCGYHGKVRSPVRACVARRRVLIYMQDLSTSKTSVLVRTKTNRRGRYGVQQAAVAGNKIFAVVKRRRVSSGGTSYLCKRARSKPLYF